MNPNRQYSQSHKQLNGKHIQESASHAPTLGDHAEKTNKIPLFSHVEARKTAEKIVDRRSTVAAILTLIVAGAMIILVVNCCISCSEQSNQNSSNLDRKDSWIDLAGLSNLSKTLDNIPSDEGLQTFSLTKLSQPKLSAEEQTNINNAISTIEQQAAVGIVLYNIKTGQGISYNPDATIYGASSFKAPYALYICEQHIETGELELPPSDGIEAPPFTDKSLVQVLIEASVINSDNDSFGTLREMFDSSGFDEWVISLNAPDTVYREDSWFPWYSARSSAKLWSEMYTYFQSGTQTSEWLSSLCEQTNVSFLRNSLEPLGATVRNKAGWCIGSDWDEYDYNAICDAGIVTLDGNTYIVSVMTGLPDGEENYTLVESLISALFEARYELN